jgi:hypothetical protein
MKFCPVVPEICRENELKYIDIRRKIEIKKMSNLMKNEII